VGRPSNGAARHDGEICEPTLQAGRSLADDDLRRCKAKSKQAGNQCRKTAIPGSTVGPAHVGKAPQVIRAAEKRIQRLVHPALGALELAITDPEHKVGKDVVAAARLARVGYGATKKVEGENVSDTCDKAPEATAAKIDCGAPLSASVPW
jgi:hypothetical protein